MKSESILSTFGKGVKSIVGSIRKFGKICVVKCHVQKLQNKLGQDFVMLSRQVWFEGDFVWWHEPWKKWKEHKFVTI